MYTGRPDGPRFAYVAVLILSFCGGCGSSERAYVTGNVTRPDGTPLPNAKLVATSADTGQSAAASTDQAGYFEFGTGEQGDGIPAGNYDVVVVEDLGDMDNRHAPTIAARYRDSATSGIKLSVTPGETTELNLKLDPP